MSALTGFSQNGAIFFRTGTAIVDWRNGVPVDAIGAICIESAPPARFQNGLPFASSGKLAALESPATRFSCGLPFTASGQLSLAADGAPATDWSSGVPFANGRICYRAAIPANRLTNSSFVGCTGSVGDADWVPPTGWLNNNWPPDDAVAIPDTGFTRIGFQTNANRGYIIQTLDLSAFIGQQVNLSGFLDFVAIQNANRTVHLTGNVTEVSNDSGNKPPGFSGRVQGIYTVVAPGTNVQVRVGAGTTTTSNQDFVISRPQVTIGSALWPYQPT